MIKPDSLAILKDYHFPGNVRELRNLLERSLLLTAPEAQWLELDPDWLQRIRAQELSASAPAGSQSAPARKLNTVEQQEYLLIQKALEEEKGAIRRAAAKLGLSHQTLLRRLEKWPELRP
jgi:transcriptional regulator with PAS, ATPase and Fis domain